MKPSMLQRLIDSWGGPPESVPKEDVHLVANMADYYAHVEPCDRPIFHRALSQVFHHGRPLSKLHRMDARRLLIASIVAYKAATIDIFAPMEEPWHD